MERKRAAGIMALCVAFLTMVEGTREHAYPDGIGVETICVGHTQNVHAGDVATPEQCNAYLANDLADSLLTVQRALKGPQPDSRIVALTSFEFNVGAGTFLRSSVLRKINAGDIRGGCDALLLYRYAGGRVLHGLVKRRARERQLCLAN